MYQKVGPWNTWSHKSPAFDGDEPKDQDAGAIILDGDRLGMCVADGTTSSPYGGDAARFLIGNSRQIAFGDEPTIKSVINGLALMDCLEKMGVTTRVQSAIPMNQIAEPFIMRRAVRHMDKGRVVIFVAGTGNPYFSTDTTAALRASEMRADVIMKATKVDGIYDKDPKKFPDAVKYEQITFIDALRQRLNVMDSTAFSLCLDNNVPILVFDLNDEHAIRRAVLGEKVGTLVKN